MGPVNSELDSGVQESHCIVGLTTHETETGEDLTLSAFSDRALFSPLSFPKGAHTVCTHTKGNFRGQWVGCGSRAQILLDRARSASSEGYPSSRLLTQATALQGPPAFTPLLLSRSVLKLLCSLPRGPCAWALLPTQTED